MAASQKFFHLLQLADRGPALRTALAEEVTELLSNWPSDYPQGMRDACEALLAKAAHDLDAATRARLRVRLYSHPELVARVLPRETASQGVIQTARQGGDIATMLGSRLGVDETTVTRILADESGVALAMACKGAGMDRAAFSALVLLARPGRDRMHAYAVLDTFDTISAREATRMLRRWRENPIAA